MKHTMTTLIALTLLLTLTGCEGDHGADHAEEDGHGHDHDSGASEGVIARITQADTKEKVGYLRLKLHDDKGDLEVWLVRDADFTKPFDVPLDTTITVTFTDKDDRTVTLRVRDRDKNEDEGGKANIREGKTNYFIFPGDSGQDASWLQGPKFLSTVKVAFTTEGKEFVTPRFILRPHVHEHSH